MNLSGSASFVSCRHWCSGEGVEMGIGSKHEVGWLAGWSVDGSDGDGEGVWDGIVKTQTKRGYSFPLPFFYITN